MHGGGNGVVAYLSGENPIGQLRICSRKRYLLVDTKTQLSKKRERDAHATAGETPALHKKSRRNSPAFLINCNPNYSAGPAQPGPWSAGILVLMIG